MAYSYKPNRARYPRAGDDIPQKVIQDLARKLPLDAHVLVGSHPTDGKETAEVDLIVITRYALHVVEVKDLRSRLLVDADGDWWEVPKSGKRRRVRGNRRGGRDRTPDAQAREDAELVKRAYLRFATKMEKGDLRVYPYVLIPYPHPESQIETSHGAWVRILDGVDSLLPSIRQRDRQAEREGGPFPVREDVEAYIKQNGLQQVLEMRGVDLRIQASQYEEERTENRDWDRHALYAYLGHTYREQGQWGEAIREYQAALAIDPQSSLVHFGLVHVYYERGRRSYEEAAVEFRAFLASRPELSSSGPHFLLGDIYTGLGLWQDAIREYQVALAIQQKD